VLLNYPPGQPIEFSMTHDDPAKLRQLEHLQPHVSHLSRGTADMLSNGVSPGARRLRLVAGGLSIALVIAGDVDLKKALDRIVKQREQQEKELTRLEGKLNNHEFRGKAPADVLAEHESRLRNLQNDQALLASSERQLRALLGP
jgi:valyl-tRNA synthetase